MSSPPLYIHPESRTAFLRDVSGAIIITITVPTHGHSGVRVSSGVVAVKLSPEELREMLATLRLPPEEAACVVSAGFE